MTSKPTSPTHPERDPADQLSQLSARYRLWLTSTIMLALATITLTVVVIIIANARDRSREEDFNVTLTAVWASFIAEDQSSIITPTPAPAVMVGEYPFEPDAAQPIYDTTGTCTEQVLAGLVTDLTGQPSDAYNVRIWGDYSRIHNLLTGEIVDEAPGAWRLVLPEAVNRRLWVQVMGGDRFLSPPVEIVFNGDDCARNRATVTFMQVDALH